MALQDFCLNRARGCCVQRAGGLGKHVCALLRAMETAGCSGWLCLALLGGNRISELQSSLALIWSSYI